MSPPPSTTTYTRVTDVIAKDSSGNCVQFTAAKGVIVCMGNYTGNGTMRWLLLNKQSEKVTTIGRLTMGTIDYCNPITLTLDEAFSATYPMSKTNAAHEGRGVSGGGVPVDVYVPWTPDECTRDVLLESAPAV